MIVSIDRANRSLGPIVPLAPQQESFYVVYADKIIHTEYFTRLGAGWFQSKILPIVFEAKGWEHGYDDDDVRRTPIMCRRPLHPLFGYSQERK